MVQVEALAVALALANAVTTLQRRLLRNESFVPGMYLAQRIRPNLRWTLFQQHRTTRQQEACAIAIKIFWNLPLKMLRVASV